MYKQTEQTMLKTNHIYLLEIDKDNEYIAHALSNVKGDCGHIAEYLLSKQYNLKLLAATNGDSPDLLDKAGNTYQAKASSTGKCSVIGSATKNITKISEVTGRKKWDCYRDQFKYFIFISYKRYFEENSKYIEFVVVDAQDLTSCAYDMNVLCKNFPLAV